MLFRFVAALLMVVVVSMAGVALEKQSLRLRRSVSRQYYQLDLLLELHAKHRLCIQQLTAPAQLAALEADRSTASVRRRSQADADPELEELSSRASRLPLLRWERPVNPAVLE